MLQLVAMLLKPDLPLIFLSFGKYHLRGRGEVFANVPKVSDLNVSGFAQFLAQDVT